MLDNYKAHLMKIRAQKLEQIDKNSSLINPFEYVKRKKQLQKEVDV